MFSRQRYWGEPIPIYFPVETDGDPRQGADYTIRYDQPHACDPAELPLELPEVPAPTCGRHLAEGLGRGGHAAHLDLRWRGNDQCRGVRGHAPRLP